MPIEILMPALSPTMTEGNLAKWLKKEGDEVHSGDVLAEIETDKATMEVEAVDDGTIGKILVPEGAQGIKVNAPIALLLGEGEEASALRDVAPASPEPPSAISTSLIMPAVAPDTSAAKVGTKARSESLVAMMTLSMACGARPRPGPASSSTRKTAASAWFRCGRRCSRHAQ